MPVVNRMVAALAGVALAGGIMAPAASATTQYLVSHAQQEANSIVARGKNIASNVQKGNIPGVVNDSVALFDSIAQLPQKMGDVAVKEVRSVSDTLIQGSVPVLPQFSPNSIPTPVIPAIPAKAVPATPAPAKAPVAPAPSKTVPAVPNKAPVKTAPAPAKDNAPAPAKAPAKAAPAPAKAPASGKNDNPDKTYIIVDGNGKERVVSKDEFFRLKQHNEKIKQHNEKIKQHNEKVKQHNEKVKRHNDALAREKAEYSDPNKAYASDLVEINKLRASHGLPPVQHDPALDAQAQQWSNNMASKKNAYHTGLNITENVSSIPSLKGSYTAFRDSTSGHKKNMLSKDVTKVGLGYAQDEDGQWYVTQMFQ